MTDPTASAALTRYPCSRLSECEWLWANTALREELRASARDPEALRTRARELVALHVIKRVPYRGASANFLNGLWRQGVSRDAVAQALADAWLAERDHFELPRRSRMAWLHTLWARVLISLLITAWLIVTGIKFMAHVNPEIDQYLITIPPLLSIAALPVLIVVFLVLNWILGLWSPKNPGASS